MVGDLNKKRNVMLDEKDRSESIIEDIEKKSVKIWRLKRVEERRRIVEEEDLRVGENGEGNLKKEMVEIRKVERRIIRERDKIDILKKEERIIDGLIRRSIVERK